MYESPTALFPLDMGRVFQQLSQAGRGPVSVVPPKNNYFWKCIRQNLGIYESNERSETPVLSSSAVTDKIVFPNREEKCHIISFYTDHNWADTRGN